MTTDRPDPRETIERIERMIEEYRAAKQRRLVQQAIKLWRRSDARQMFAKIEEPPERVH